MRALLFILFAVAGVGLSLVLGGCAVDGVVQSSGIVAPAPFGWDEHCKVEPGPECPKN
jgi:hypothetical protein